MKRALFFCLIFLWFTPFLFGQSGLVAGPMKGFTTAHSAKFWMLFQDVNEVELKVLLNGKTVRTKSLKIREMRMWKDYSPVTLEFTSLEAGQTYELEISTDKGKLTPNPSFRTRPVEEPKAFTFLLGSCTYKGVGIDQMANPRGLSFDIFDQMAAVEANFMLWMGDNIYYVGGDWNNLKRMGKKNIGVRLEPQLNHFLTTSEHYAIWDDHDFGPNNSDGTFKNKTETLEAFQRFWANPTRDGDVQGVFHTFTYGDAQFFMMDDRFHRIDQDFMQMWGKEQMGWLKEELRNSTANFKFIVNGNQVLNETGGHESLASYEREYKELFSFIKEEQIDGIFFLTGDRHFSELLKKDMPGMYPMYDLTVSPLTSWLRRVAGRDEEAENPLRVPGSQLIDHNFGRISFSGEGATRQFKIELITKTGETAWEKTIRLSEISF